MAATSPMHDHSSSRARAPEPLVERISTGCIGDAFLVCDSQGTLAYLNGAAESLLALDARLILGRPLDSILHLRAEDGQRFGWERLTGLARRKSAIPVRALCRLVRNDGSEHVVSCETVAVDALVAMVLVQERSAAEDHKMLAYRASHDALTGLPNRAALQERLALLHQSADSLGSTYGLLLLDLDHFKVINDRFGHTAGDRALAQIGQRLAETVRDGDTVGRWGGEEFLCLLPQVDRHRAAEIAERVRAGIEAAPVKDDKRQIRVTASIGAVAFPDDGGDPDLLLAKADSALYEAKRAGRNRVRCHTGSSSEVFRVADTIESALRKNHVRAAYQPIVDLVTGEVRGEEALARIERPDGQWMAAGDFIPAAEQLNLVHQIDHRIIQQAIRRCVQRTLAGLPPHAMFVNFSADFLRHPRLVQDILDTVKQNCALCEPQLSGSKPLVLEITERQFMHDTEEARQILEPFRELGLRFAIDDFGAGHSSLDYLAELPVQFVKIEGSLVRRIVTEPRVRAVVRAIQSLAADLGVVTVAEGIEDQATLDIVRHIGIDWGQGYLVANPQPGSPEPQR